MDSFRDTLVEDHARCDALLRGVIAAVSGKQWALARFQVAEFAGALERHLLIEERIVFPAFERKFRYAVLPTVALRSEHLRIRAVLQRLRNAVQEQEQESFVGHADALLLLMHQHCEKEEGMVYPMIERALGKAARQLIGAISAFGAEDDGDEDGDATPARPATAPARLLLA